MKQEEALFLSSAESFKISLEAVRTGRAGLSERRKNILKRVPKSGDWSGFPKESISLKDMAFLSASVHHEFALLRGKKKDILFHGVASHCHLDDNLIRLLKEHKLELVAHTHPDWGMVTPSRNDRIFLQEIGQKTSVIISWITGKELTFGSNLFEDI